MTELRVVTVLFLDIVGSTALVGRLDPEDAAEVLDGALERFSDVVRAHGGRVLQYAGDNLLAAFGADSAQEDDAERAVHAGLALLAAGRDEAQRVASRFGASNFGVRIGLHSGPVLLGSAAGVDRDGSIRGITVHLAARMEQAAPAGSLRISAQTQRLVRGRFELEQQAPLAIKGPQRKLVTYLVRRALPAAERVAERGVEGVATPLIGRAAARAWLEARLRACADTGQAQLALVVAEPGLGKSRLFDEFALACRSQVGSGAERQGARVLRAWAHPHGRGQAHALLRELLFGAVGIGDDQTLDAALGRWRSALAAALDGDQIAVLGQLLGLAQPEHPAVLALGGDGALLQRRARPALARLWAAWATASPGQALVLMLDDLHWADDASIELIEATARGADAPPLLLLGSTRPELFEQRPGLWSGAPQHRLLPLDATDRDALARALLVRFETPPADLVALLGARSEGNPFQMEEVLAWLIESGVVDTGSEAGAAEAATTPWRFDPALLAGLAVPTTLQALLQARLDGLPAAERRALHQASVVGARFWDEALARIDSGALRALPGLLFRELALPDEAALFVDANAYRFKHQLLHQVAYAGVLRADKRAWHAAVAAWLVDRAGDRIDEFLSLIAEHLESAADATAAAGFALRAARQADASGAHEITRREAERALRTLPEDAADARFEAQALRTRALLRGSDDAVQAEALATLDTLAAAGPPAWRAEAARLRMLHLRRLGRHAEAWALVPQAIADAGEGEGKGALAAQLHYMAGSVAFNIGRLDDAEAHCQAGWRLAQAAALRMLPLLLEFRGQIRNRRGDKSGAVPPIAEAVELYRTQGNRWGEVRGRVSLAAALMDTGELDAALAQFDQVVALARPIGADQEMTIAEANRAEVHSLRGEAEAALAAIEAAIAGMRRLGLHSLVALTSIHRARLLVRAGRVAEAAAVAREANAASAGGHNPLTEAETWVALADVALAEGDTAAAAAWAVQVVDADTAGRAPLRGLQWPLHAADTLARVATARGDAAGAARWRSVVVEMLQARAATLPEAVRAGFLALPGHAALLRPAAAGQAAAGGVG